MWPCSLESVKSVDRAWDLNYKNRRLFVYEEGGAYYDSEFYDDWIQSMFSHVTHTKIG